MMNKKSDIFASLLLAAMTIGSSSAGSDTIHDQSMVDINAFGWDSVGGPEIVQQIADDFKPSVDGSIAFLNWTGKYHDSSEPAAKRFELRLFADAAGHPGNLIFSQSLPVAASPIGGLDIGAHKLLNYTAALTGSPILKTGSTYWLSIREIDPSTSAMWSWSFHNSDVAGGYSYRRKGSALWVTGAQDMAYSLSIAPVK